jgi:hypothetical protein
MSKLQDITYRAVLEWFPNDSIYVNFRPLWLCGLELDIYCPRLSFAIEVQGRQHRFFCPTLFASFADYQKQIERDQLKRRLARRYNVCLIAVKEGDRRILGGLSARLSKLLHQPFRVSAATRNKWDTHQRLLAQRQQESNIAFKVRKGGKLCPINKASSLWLQSQSKSPIKTKLSGAAHLTPAHPRECVVTRILSSPGVVPTSVDLHPGGAVAVIYPVRA